MSKKTDILADASLKVNPFSLPDSYAAGLENRVHDRITAEDAIPSTFWGRAKAPVMLALTFCIIFGMGYGVLSLTGTKNAVSDVPSETMAETLESWSLPSTFIEDYYHEMNPDYMLEHSITNIEITDDMESEILNLITMNDIIENYQ